MAPRSSWLLPLLVLIGADPAAAQLPVPITVETRAGYALPSGRFAAEDESAGAEGGPSVAVGVRVQAHRLLGVYGGVQQTRFGCTRCATFDLDETIVASGGEGGIHVVLPGEVAGFTLWVRAGLVHQVLRYSGEGDRIVSRSAVGFSGSTGGSYSLGRRWSLTPGVRFLSVPADFQFVDFPQRSIDVTAFSVDLGVALRF
jgi:hypothetical protein